MKKYKYRIYKPYYPLLFKREKQKLEKILPKQTLIEHVGSTSVKGLGGKGIIDILISVPKIHLMKIRNILIKNGYEYKDDKKRYGRLYFVKDNFYFIKYRVHIQLTFIGSKYQNNVLNFRDVLRTNENVRKKYKEIKKEGIKIAKGVGKKYRKHKKEIKKYASSYS